MLVFYSLLTPSFVAEGGPVLGIIHLDHCEGCGTNWSVETVGGAVCPWLLAFQHILSVKDLNLSLVHIVGPLDVDICCADCVDSNLMT